MGLRREWKRQKKEVVSWQIEQYKLPNLNKKEKTGRKNEHRHKDLWHYFKKDLTLTSLES